jgi:hypothetical protein
MSGRFPMLKSRIIVKDETYNFNNASHTEYNSLILHMPAMKTELQLNRCCTTFTRDSAIKFDTSLFAQYTLNLLRLSSLIMHTFNISPVPSVITVQTRYCIINTACVEAPLMLSREER